FHLQPLSPTEAAVRAKESAKNILNIKTLIDKKNFGLTKRNRVSKNSPASSSKLSPTLLFLMWKLDYAEMSKSNSYVEKYYSETESHR
ncbi:unnamed protein product, partial [Thlaspi arvense]